MSDNFSINKYWSVDEFNKAHQMASLGHSAREIGIVLGRSKNSVIGVLHRSGFIWGTKKKPASPVLKGPPNRKQERARNQLGRFRRLRDEQPVAPTFFPAEQIQHEGVSFLDLRSDHCRAIHGDPCGAQTIYCGESKTSNSPYCEHHYIKYHKKAA